LDKELSFDGSNMPIEKFIKRYEAAGKTDGASSQDLANQIIPFIKGMDLKDEVEEMSGYEDSNWEKLKKQLLNRFGSSLPLVKYTSHDLKHLVSSAIRGGGIKTLEHFKIFRTKFEAITHYLVGWDTAPTWKNPENVFWNHSAQTWNPLSPKNSSGKTLCWPLRMVEIFYQTLKP
jgi:hypothetical protein